MDKGSRGKHYKVIGWILNLPLTSSTGFPQSPIPVYLILKISSRPILSATFQWSLLWLRTLFLTSKKNTWLSLTLSSFLHVNQITSTKWISAYAFLIYVLLLSYLFQFLSKNIYNSCLTSLCADLGYQPQTGVGSIHEVRTSFLQESKAPVEDLIWSINPEVLIGFE